MVTLTFNPIAIPEVVSVICALWAIVWMSQRNDSAVAYVGRPMVWLVGVGIPAFPALIAWLIWAVLT